MNEYENLIEALVGMAEISRPRSNPNASREEKIQHGICDLLEDAAVAIDELMKRIPIKNEQREFEAA